MLIGSPTRSGRAPARSPGGDGAGRRCAARRRGIQQVGSTRSCAAMESVERREAGRAVSGEQSAGRNRSDPGTTRADRSSRRIPAPARHLARPCALARRSSPPGDSGGDVRACRDGPASPGAATRMQEGRLQVRRTRPGRTPERKCIAPPGGVVTHVRWDVDRESRTGVPEVVYGPGKTPAHLRQIFENTSELRMASRLSEEQMEVLSDLATIYREARMAVRNPRARRDMPLVPVITAGTADIPVALEAATTLDAMGVPTAPHFDVGVAGIHRLQSILPELAAARVCIVVAGMDGALPAVIAGLLRAPVIGVPTSVGTGVAQGGMVALNTMLASCSPGVAVVNIDNGFGAACLALKILGSNQPD